MSIDKPPRMASAAISPYSVDIGQQSKKRSYLEVNRSTPNRPVKRLQSLNLPAKLSETVSRGSIGPQKSAVQATGLENSLNLDLHFVESTKATEDDEAARRGFHPTIESNYDDMIFERRYLAGQIQSSLEPDLGSGRGIINFTGYLCYRHSLFQALVHTPKFVHWLLDYHGPSDCVSDDSQICVSCQMRKLVHIYWDEKADTSDLKTQVINLDKIFTHWGWKPSGENNHGDPDDQLAWMLNIMRTEMPRSVFGYFDAINNTILESEIKCGKCGYVSKTRGNNERHFSIPIRVPGLASRHLRLLIQAYMDETIQGYRCENEKCKHVSDKHRIQKIAFAPDVLLIQLKRFNYRGVKDNALVTYGAELDLSPYCANPSLGPLSYNLTAVISHSGYANFGHYHCLAKGPNGQWFEYDDGHIIRCSIKEVLQPNSLGQAWTPYLLFYERKRASMPPI